MLKETLLFGLFLLVGFQSLLDPNYKPCKTPMALYFALIPWNMSILVVVTGFLTRNICQNIFGPLCVVFFITLVLLIFMGFPLLIWTIFVSPRCTPSNYVITNWIFVTLTNTLMYFLISILIGSYCKHRKKQKQGAVLRKQIDKIYDRVIKKDFDIEAFITKHGEEVINLF
jgi:hypothetical protein